MMIEGCVTLQEVANRLALHIYGKEYMHILGHPSVVTDQVEPVRMRVNRAMWMAREQPRATPFRKTTIRQDISNMITHARWHGVVIEFVLI